MTARDEGRWCWSLVIAIGGGRWWWPLVVAIGVWGEGLMKMFSPWLGALI